MLKVSLITATWNSSSSISSAIDSVNTQTYQYIEHIFIDGASKDNTLEIIKSKSLRDNHVLSEPDNGIYDALNKGIALSTGDIIGFVHSDDFLAHDRVIEHVVKTFSSDTSPHIVYGDLEYVLKDNTHKVFRRWISGNFNRDKFTVGWMPPHPAVFIKKSSYEKFGCFDLSYQISSDYDSLIKFMWLNNLDVVYFPEILVKMRVGGESNRCIERILQKSKEDYLILKKYGLPAFKCLFLKNFSKLSQFFIS